MSNDAAQERLADMLAGLRGQLTDIAAVQKKQAALVVKGEAADGAVEVTVDARGRLVKTAIDETYLDDHDFDELAGFITEAAQAAAGEAARQVAEMLAPINERHRKFPAFSDIIEGLPDPTDLMPGLDAFGVAGLPGDESSRSSAGGIYDSGEEGTEFPTVRR